MALKYPLVDTIYGHCVWWYMCKTVTSTTPPARTRSNSNVNMMYTRTQFTNAANKLNAV